MAYLSNGNEVSFHEFYFSSGKRLLATCHVDIDTFLRPPEFKLRIGDFTTVKDL